MQQAKLPLFVVFVENELAIVQVNKIHCLPMFSSDELAIDYVQRVAVNNGDYSRLELSTPDELMDFLLTDGVPDLIVIDPAKNCDGGAIRKRDLLIAMRTGLN